MRNLLGCAPILAREFASFIGNQHSANRAVRAVTNPEVSRPGLHFELFTNLEIESRDAKDVASKKLPGSRLARVEVPSRQAGRIALHQVQRLGLSSLASDQSENSRADRQQGEKVFVGFNNVPKNISSTLSILRRKPNLAKA